jgi:secondary thiamine-phosphate synthase enzyme
MVMSREITLNTKGHTDIIDITAEVEDFIGSSGVNEGIAHVFIIGSTGSVSTIEYEPALVEDFKEKIDDLVPHNMRSRHSQTWGDDNGFSHIRATLMGSHLTIPVTKGAAVLGTWQQIIVLDHDNRPRSRRVFLQVMGE